RERRGRARDGGDETLRGEAIEVRSDAARPPRRELVRARRVERDQEQVRARLDGLRRRVLRRRRRHEGERGGDEGSNHGASVLHSVAMHPAALPIELLLKDVEYRTTRGPGPGGQHRNKSDTMVRLT